MPGPTILVVDDNPVNLRLVEFILSKQGYTVRTASSSFVALDVLEKSCVDLVLLDIQMPELDGIELARRLRSNPETREIPIVALSGHALSSDATASCAEFDHYLAKPVERTQLGEVVERLLHARAQRPS